MRVVSERILVKEFFDFYVDGPFRYYVPHTEEFLAGLTTLWERAYWRQKDKERQDSYVILEPFFIELEKLDRKSCSIDDVNRIVLRMREATDHISNGNAAPYPIKPLASCCVCDRDVPVIMEFDVDCSDCGQFYVCYGCITFARVRLGEV